MSTRNERVRSVFMLLVFGAFVVSAGGFLTACNTIQGAGDDIEAAGDGISDAARDAKD